MLPQAPKLNVSRFYPLRARAVHFASVRLFRYTAPVLTALSYKLRQEVFGKWVLRPGLPRIVPHPDDLKERAYYTKLFTAATTTSQRQAVGQLIDVGCRNWSYAPALADCFPNAELIGVELDGLRRYWDLYRRIDYAKAYAASTHRKARAVLGDFRSHRLEPPERGGVTLFCFLFPFVTENPCLRWGLPERFADYSALLRHALNAGGNRAMQFLCVHQGDWEADVARELYEELGFTMHSVKLTPQSWAGLWPSPHDNWVFFGGM